MARERARLKYAAAPEAKLESVRRYRQFEHGRLALATKNAKRRALKRGMPSLPYTRAEVYVKTSGRCWSCWAPLDITAFVVDHVVPLGTTKDDPATQPWQVIGCDCRANLLPQCGSCSSRKRQVLDRRPR